MSSDPGAPPAISVRSVTKTYQVKDAGGSPTNLRELLSTRARRPLARSARHRFAALDDVSLDVPQGEILGVIGANGAGKSTLLKILTRITTIDRGRIEIRGRVGSLLEVGTGFHPELTGRENIFLNGTILGMSRREVRQKFDEILAFAEVEDFVDTPVKRYSSGMAVRLAFSVAVHLDAEILLVDEVLAVGDATFQRKCLDKIEEVATGQGRTVLFVSHNMAPIRSMCRRAVVLANGAIKYDGDTATAIETYLASMPFESSADGVWDLTDRPGAPDHASEPALRRVALESQPDRPTSLLQTGEPLRIRVRVGGLTRAHRPVLGVRVNAQGDLAVATFVSRAGSLEPATSGGECEAVLTVDRLPLTPGRYTVDLWVLQVDTWSLADMVSRAASFEVDSREGGYGAYQAQYGDGAVVVPATWEVTGTASDA